MEPMIPERILQIILYQECRGPVSPAKGGLIEVRGLRQGLSHGGWGAHPL